MPGERLHDFWLRLKGVVKRRQLDRDLAEELEFHLAMREQKLIEQGMAPPEARCAARRGFGNVVRLMERSREMWSFPSLETLLQDFRYGLRQLRRGPGFTVVAILTLALGIGANTAIFSVVNAVLLRPLPYKDPEKLATPSDYAASPADFLDWRRQSKAFEEIAAIDESEVTLVGRGAPTSLKSQQVSASFFQILGVRPMLGRTFLAVEDQPGRDGVAILSYGLWQSRTGADRGIVGQAVRLDGNNFTVVGVMPPAFRSSDFLWGRGNAEIWLPNPFRHNPPTERYARTLRTIGRLKDGVSVEQAQAEMETIQGRLIKLYPYSHNAPWGRLGSRVILLHDLLVQNVRPRLLLLMGAVGLVLLMACFNVANLLLARGTLRQREMAVRVALGAGRGRLVRQLLAEGALLTMVGAAAGILLAFWGTHALVAISPADLPFREEIGISRHVLGFTFLVSVLAWMTFGIVPALRGSTPGLNESLKEASRSSGEARGGRRLRGLLVVSQVALAMMILAGAGLLINSFLRLLRVDLGFSPQNLVVAEVNLFRTKYADVVGMGSHEKLDKGQRIWGVRPNQDAFVSRVLEKLEGIPGVKSAAAINFFPLYGWAWGNYLKVEGRPASPSGKRPAAYFLPITSEYFRTMEIPLLKGHDFGAPQAAAGGAVAVIDQAFARRYFPDQDPLGKHLSIADGVEEPEKSYEIIGVVGAIRQMGLQGDFAETVYVPYSQQGRRYVQWQMGFRQHVSFVVRTSADPASLAPAFRRAIWEEDRDQPIKKLTTMERFISDTLSERRFYLITMAIFAAVALLLAAAGVYGVISYSVGQRTHEVGVRMALGAGRSDVVRLVVGQGLKLTIIGLTVGIPGAYALTRFLSSLLYGVKPSDPVTFVIVSSVLTAVALLAAYIPARRATRVDPLVALRYE